MTDAPSRPDHPTSRDASTRPALLVFDVNETLSDMTPMSRRFEAVGAPGHLAKLWFAEVLRDRFDRLLTVEDAGLWKPAARAYAYALEECAVEPNDAMLVAVHPWDIDGASRAGLATAWINRPGAHYPSYFAAPDVEAESLLRLAYTLR